MRKILSQLQLQLQLRRAAGLSRGLFARRRQPTPLHKLQPATAADDTTRWGWGLFAGTFIIGLLGLAVILEDDAYLVEMSVQAQGAFFDGYVQGYRRGRAFMREQMIDGWGPQALAGEHAVDCTLPATPAQADAQRRAALAQRQGAQP